MYKNFHLQFCGRTQQERITSHASDIIFVLAEKWRPSSVECGRC